MSIPVSTTAAAAAAAAAAACVKKRAPVSGDASRAVAFGPGMLLLLGRLTRAERPAGPPAQDRDHRAIYGPPGDRRSAPRSSAGPRCPTDALPAPRPKYGPREAGIPVEYVSAWKTLLCVVTGSGGVGR